MTSVVNGTYVNCFYVLVVHIVNEKINIFGKNCKNFFFLFNGILSAKYLSFFYRPPLLTFDSRLASMNKMNMNSLLINEMMKK